MDDAKAPAVPGYDVGRLLGRGGSADVWLAREQRTGRDVALKCFRTAGSRTLGGTAISEEEMRREIRVLSVLEHQHLIRAVDAVRLGDVDGGTALTMDYAAGGSLAQLVTARGKLTVGETVTVLTPIAQALGYLHDKGFTHSDVSPGNVLFTGQGKPMLSDVGVARMLGDPGGPAAAGTAGFQDPSPVDVVRAGLQPERDVYSAAALGWFCLTGAAPGRTADRPPLSLLVPGVPRELAAILEAGLNEDRRLRPNALALATAVYRSAEPQPVDLSDAVHPTVLPELLTRRRITPQTKGAGLRMKLQALRRRLATSHWSALSVTPSSSKSPAGRPKPQSPGQRPQLVEKKAALGQHGKHVDRPSVEQGKHADGPAVLQGKHAEGPSVEQGKHAEGPGTGRRARIPARAVLPAIAAAVAAIWWLSAAGQPPWPGSAATGSQPAVARPHDAVEEAGTKADAPVEYPGQQARAADPAIAVQGLAALRDRAFNSGRLDLLADVNAPGSAAAAADERIAAQLRKTGHRLAGFTSTLAEVATEEGATQDHAVVRVVSATSGYSTVNAENSVLGTGAPSQPQPLRLVLVSVDGQWRVSEILAGQ